MEFILNGSREKSILGNEHPTSRAQSLDKTETCHAGDIQESRSRDRTVSNHAPCTKHCRGEGRKALARSSNQKSSVKASSKGVRGLPNTV